MGNKEKIQQLDRAVSLCWTVHRVRPQGEAGAASCSRTFLRVTGCVGPKLESNQVPACISSTTLGQGDLQGGQGLQFGLFLPHVQRILLLLALEM